MKTNISKENKKKRKLAMINKEEKDEDNEK